jgi:hypothetical protein
MTSRAEIKITDLDFDSIKNNLKHYLRSQEEFKDYNFEGSGMSILLDLLAYNTHYQSFYANMVANEMFMDSAVLRNSVVSLGKHLSYVPRSVTAPVATLNLKWISNPGAYVSRGSIFTATSDGQTYSFVTLSNHDILETEASTSWEATNVQVYEGRISTISFVADSNNPDQRFVVPDKNVDTRTLTVRVQTSRANTEGFSSIWEPVRNIVDLTTTSKAYFIQEIEDEKYEIYFGDGVVSEAISDGNIITIEYLSSHGADANNIGHHDSASAPTFNYGTASVKVLNKAGGGAVRESTDSVKYYAPLAYQAQERAVTTNDYEYILLRDYPDIKSVYIWGGEDNEPPQYGKVFISLKPKEGRWIGELEKITIAQDLLKRRNVVGILPEVVDPVYVFLNFNGTVNYDSRKTISSGVDLAEKVHSYILTFVESDLEKFNKSLYYSKFSAGIDAIDDAILSNNIEIQMEFRLAPRLNDIQTYEFGFGNGIYHPHDGHIPVLTTTSFTHFNGVDNVPSFIEDDGYGKLRLYNWNTSGDKNIYNDAIGSVDYSTGKIVVKGFAPISIPNVSEIKFYANPDTKDIEIQRNIILTSDTTNKQSIELTMVDTSRTGNTGETRYIGGRTY